MADNSSAYPGAVDSFTARAATMNLAAKHGDDHDKMRDGMVKTQTELGTNPSGASATVAARFTADEALITALQALLPSGAAVTNWASPTVGGLTKGNGTESSAYYIAGPLTFCYYRFILGTTSAVSGDLSINTPTAMIFGSVNGSGYFVDASATRFKLSPDSIGTTTVLMRPLVASGTYVDIGTACSATVPFTWTSTDSIMVNWYYRNA